MGTNSAIEQQAFSLPEQLCNSLLHWGPHSQGTADTAVKTQHRLAAQRLFLTALNPFHPTNTHHQQLHMQLAQSQMHLQSGQPSVKPAVKASTA